MKSMSHYYHWQTFFLLLALFHRTESCVGSNYEGKVHNGRKRSREQSTSTGLKRYLQLIISCIQGAECTWYLQ